jgi:gamma-glutamyltranspeptidase/glutathione hydrolase
MIRCNFKKGSLCGAFLLLSSLLSVAVLATERPPHAAIATAHPLATAAGFEMLNQGGNAFDAAVAVSAALAVVEPMGSGLGGGGFWLLHRAKDNRQIMLDGRERAPLAATRDMYLDKKGEPIPNLSVDGALSAAIPGLPAALVYLAEKQGRLPLAKSLAPAIRYATEGFEVGARYRVMAGFRLKALLNSEAAAKVFLANGKLVLPSFKLVQKDLAKTLEAIAEQGHKGFYAGEVAKKLLKGVREGGGIWTQQDLDEYQVIERQPIQGNYKGVRVTSAAPPSSGGVVLMEILNILSGYDLDKVSEVDKKHLVIEAMRRAYHDRARYLGDADFVEMPLDKLQSMSYAATRRESIQLTQATKSSALAKTADSEAGGEDTTHFSILDKEGNRVAATLSINYPFGSAFMPAGTGVVLNDEMDDFSKKAGSPNVYGLVGSQANAIEPGKRMLSSMSPTFLEDADRVAILGTPGGSRIITMVLLAILDFEEGNGVESWVKLPRYHHQYLPDVVQYEKEAFNKAELLALTKRGHTLKEMRREYGNMQAILWDKKKVDVKAASDSRGEGHFVVN